MSSIITHERISLTTGILTPGSVVRASCSAEMPCRASRSVVTPPRTSFRRSDIWALSTVPLV